MQPLQQALPGQPEEAPTGPSEKAIQQYKICAEKFPESAFVGRSLIKVVEYYIYSKDFSRADNMLEQIFQDYPDGDFLGDMLWQWVQVASSMGNTQKAVDKCSQLLFEYPSSKHADEAKEMLPKLKAMLEKPAAPAKAPGAQP